MASWFCAECEVGMEEVEDIKITFGEVELPDAQGIRCPDCGREYLLEEFVMDELKPAEEMLEGK